ncbi:hypothetical protein [Paenibacillus humicus]|uniref:hypothetical protein n=1 Tax=Paenibacillus humicus TaxID=412861 RepID=UPI003F14D22F
MYGYCNRLPEKWASPSSIRQGRFSGCLHTGGFFWWRKKEKETAELMQALPERPAPFSFAAEQDKLKGRAFFAVQD